MKERQDGERKCYKCSVVGSGFVREMLRITPFSHFATAGKKFVVGLYLFMRNISINIYNIYIYS